MFCFVRQNIQRRKKKPSQANPTTKTNPIQVVKQEQDSPKNPIILQVSLQKDRIV
jgi:hypothetical protein